MPECYRTEVIAQLFGLSVRRIQQLTQDGIIKTQRDKDGVRKYELVSTIQRYIKYLSEKAYGRSKTERESELKEQKLRAEIALKEIQGELQNIRKEIATGKYISVEEVQLDYSKFFVAFKKFAMSIPNRIIGRINGYIEPIQARGLEKDMTNEISEILRSFVINCVSSKF